MKTFRVIAIFLLIAWMTMIFCFSAQTAAESSGTSGRVITAVVRFFYSEFDEMESADQQALISSLQFIARKGAHFSIYGILGILAFLSVMTYKKVYFVLRLIISFMICLLYSASDEIHQCFVPGRSGEIRDVIIDTSGAIIGILFLTLVTRIRWIYKYVYNGDLMRKKDLRKLYEQAYELIGELNDELENVKFENTSLNAKVKELEARNIIAEDILAIAGSDVNNEKTEITKEPVENIALFTKEKEFGAQAIGRIIINAAKYCNKLTGFSENADVKELINLVLGRTEVAKAEILNIISEDISFDEMCYKINKEEVDSEDYFISVLGQIEN